MIGRLLSSRDLQVIGFFSHRLEQAGSDLSVERVQEVIMKGAQALPTDRLTVDPSHTHTHTHLLYIQYIYIYMRLMGLLGKTR